MRWWRWRGLRAGGAVLAGGMNGPMRGWASGGAAARLSEGCKRALDY
jgi:hypothetical protein